MGVWESNEILLYVCMAVYVVFAIVGISLLVVVYIVAKKQKTIANIAEIFPMTIQTITYSEIPVIARYVKDAKYRRSIVLKHFRKDPITDHFIKRYPSKFIKNGYVGEELLNAAA
ncbi:hypothetical protein DdX_04285 [Ditylenchus destructor]|uniref:Uncharacterized protein n=1 Tax=Ditylenchus destructor TaxID=166010 RepID=A0AAD4N9A2_9BILA|nr:hypothetical protein DdX_04285 [Ditylenchus destructor]